MSTATLCAVFVLHTRVHVIRVQCCSCLCKSLKSFTQHLNINLKRESPLSISTAADTSNHWNSDNLFEIRVIEIISNNPIEPAVITTS